MMTNYNDGKWHGWQCDWENPPVHEETEVEVTNGSGLHRQKSRNTNWGAVIAFRVIKEYKGPREFWIVNSYMYTTLESAETYAVTFGFEQDEIIHVREVQQ